MNPIERLLEQFVADATRVVQTMAVDALRSALGKQFETAAHAQARVPAAQAVRRPRQPRRRRVVDTAKLGDQIVKALRARSERTIGELSGDTGQATGVLQPVVKKLISDKRIRFEGETRGRRYSVVSGTKPKTGRKKQPHGRTARSKKSSRRRRSESATKKQK